jgi:hypothetical protein
VTGLCHTADRHDYWSSYALALRILRARQEAKSSPVQRFDGSEGEKFPCLSGRCLSPIACNAFGYCREKNFTESALRSHVGADSESSPPETSLHSRRGETEGLDAKRESVTPQSGDAP